MATSQEQLVGKLIRGVVSVGAEGTGWMIVPHNEQGNLAGVEVDVRPVQATADKLVGTEVRATGVYSVASGSERGKTKVFLVQRLEAVH